MYERKSPEIARTPSVKCSKFDDRDFIIQYDKHQVVNSTALFFCKDDHKILDGPNVVTCLSNGKWSSGPPICKNPLNCSKFDDEDFVIFYDKEPSINSSAVFFCKDMNKKLEGSNIVTCLPNGKWSDDPPKCKSAPTVKCPKFDDIELFILYDNGQDVNSIAVFFCTDKRKKLHGKNLVTCLPNGQWSGDPPKCKVTCPSIEETEGMRVFYTKNLDEGSIAAFLCSYPRTRFGVVWTTCKANGEWTDPPPKCISSSCFLEKLFDVIPENVVPVVEGVTSDTLPLNFSLHLICKNNTTLNGSDTAHCGENGTWEVSKVQCPPSVKCSKFDDRELIIHYDKEQAVNSSALFLCKDDHKKLDGPNTVTCLSNGQWSSGPPICKTTCPMIEETEGMSVSYTKGVDEGSIAAFHCLEPRTRTGVPRTTCKNNGSWTHPPARCTLLSCPLDQLFDVVPANVVPVMEGVASDTLPYNFTLRLTCEDNMMLSGSDVAKCGQDGKWQVSSIQCISGCVLPRIENSELIIEPDKSFYRFGESVVLSCSTGYVLNSDAVRLMCLGTSWSENVPECRKK
ncbi:Sushi, von Willebrand factor type A, EGF and pentraxin domain-containing protein 1 [Araneus ventricosus]|uniref:Sushi, von Willebrand factor type A, EGF and pentraxin domain-containing protein 1 n=1 Tax=Araneus ventricosus TaxID=182803 RepID=A0A4Y2LR40_ARAVE|nr:Sushi, von Willebrand factor type A, EGF and pentraxin domain-containing protein 1 [Araneus ventricosus]